MKKRYFLLSVAMMSMASFGFAQITTPKGSASDETNVKMAKLDLLVKILPLALRKDQYPDLLNGLELARDMEKQELETEDTELSVLDGPLTDAIAKAVEKGDFPSKDVQKSITDEVTAAAKRRQNVHFKMIKVVTDAVESKLNAGQRKVMTTFMASDPVSQKADDEVKLRLYIDQVLLDPLAYDLLVEMAKHAS